jgi:hypothetical protein
VGPQTPAEHARADGSGDDHHYSTSGRGNFRPHLGDWIAHRVRLVNGG